MSNLLKKILEVLEKEGPLKAKKIALLLDSTRTTITHTNVNSELYKALDLDLDGLTKDEQSIWSYVNPKIIKIFFDSPSSWLSAWNIENVLKNYPNLLNTKSEIEFHFSNKPIFLDCILKILSITNQLVQAGSKVILKFAQDSDGFRYLSRCGFFDNLHENVQILPFRPSVSLAEKYHANSITLFEIFAIKRECDRSLLSRLSTIIEDKLSEDDATKLLNKILTLIGELVDNIHQHGLSEIDGYIALQIYNSKKIVISISDSGDGLINSLRKKALIHYQNDPELRKFSKSNLDMDIQLIGHVFNKGKISRTGENGRGLGLSKSNKALQKMSLENVKKINLSIRQQNYELNFPYDTKGIGVHDCRITQNLTYIDGTHYVVTIKT